MSLQRVHNVKQVREQFFPGRCARWIRNTFADGELGPVFRDDGGWLISETAIARWFDLHQPKKLTLTPRASQVDNLRQNTQ